MSRIVRLVQGSDEWHRHRMLHRNASETAAALGVCPWMTRFQLWEIKTGRRVVEPSYPMQRGIELEPFARASYEADTGHIMEPVVMVKGDYSASLDGLSFDGALILEVKCPLKGQESDTWYQVKAGEVPVHYAIQVQHQLMVSGAQACDFYTWDGKDSGVALRVTPDEEVMARIRAAWDEFWKYIIRDEPPPLTAKDTLVREDAAWCKAAEAFVAAKQAADEAAKAAENAKRRLVELTRHNSERGAGVSVTRFWRGLKETKEEIRVTVLKQEGEPC